MVEPKIVPLLAVASCVVFTCCTPKRHEAAIKPTARAEPRPYRGVPKPSESYATPEEELGKNPHELVLASLRTDHSALPRQPKAHPFRLVFNREAVVVPPMCYTRTEGTHNPCYVCHQDAIPDRENRMADGDLQAEYSFSELGAENH